MGQGFLESSAQSSFEKADFVVLPIPYDITASWGRGARLGPKRIFEASKELELFDEELLIEPFRPGIHTLPPLELPILPDLAKRIIKEGVRIIFESEKCPVSIGGDHSVSIGLIEMATAFYKELTVIHFDAHADLRESYQDTSLSHACVMRRVWDTLNGKVIQVGIRSLSRNEWAFLEKEGKEPVWARDIRNDLKRAVTRIAAAVHTKRIYITLDVDCLDPSIMPATGTPEPGGLLWHELLEILKTLCQKHRVVGFDVVELSPIPGIVHPDFLAARLIYKMIGYISRFQDA